MATVTGLTAARTLELLDTMVVGADVVAGDLILTREDGSTVNVGSVVGPEGPAGPAGPAGEGGSGSGSRTLLLADVMNPNTIADTLQDVTGLSFPVVSGKKYRFRFLIDFDAGNALNGTRWTLNGPAFSRLTYMVTNANGSTAIVTRNLSAYNSGSVGTGSTALSNLAVIEGIIHVSASGTVIARFSGEDAGIPVTAKGGSFVEFEEITDVSPTDTAKGSRIVRATANYTTSSAEFVDVDSVNLAPIIPCSGLPLVVDLMTTIHTTVANGLIDFRLTEEGVAVPGSVVQHQQVAGGVLISRFFRWIFLPTAGNRKIALQWLCTSPATMQANSGIYTTMRFVEEDLTLL